MSGLRCFEIEEAGRRYRVSQVELAGQLWDDPSFLAEACDLRVGQEIEHGEFVVRAITPATADPSCFGCEVDGQACHNHDGSSPFVPPPEQHRAPREVGRERKRSKAWVKREKRRAGGSFR